MLTFLNIAGGVALILFGVRFLRKGLDRLFGPRLGHWMQRLADHRFKAFISGMGASLVAPSSTTMSVLAVQTVQAGQMTARQMLAVMFGADIGLTMTVALISLRVEQYAPILILLGVALFQFSKLVQTRGMGQVIVSFGFIFMGIDIIKHAAHAVGMNQDMLTILEVAEKYPFAMAGVAAVTALLLQSSTATIGLVIGLGIAGAVKLPMTIAVVIGANVGIVITTMIVGWSRIETRRLALGNLLVKSFVAVALLMAMPYVIDLAESLPGSIEHKVALTHTSFNILVALIGLPFVDLIYRLTKRVLPEPVEGDRPAFGPRYIGRKPPESVALALGQSMREIMHVAEIVREMLDDCWRALKADDIQLADKVGERDDQVDMLDEQVKRYLTKVVGMAGESDETGEQMRQLRYLNELETIGDIIDKNLTELVVKKASNKLWFTDEGMAELDDLYHKVAENLLIADTAFTTRDRMLAAQLLRHKEKINQLDRELRDKHFARLNAGKSESHETSAVHLDVLTYLKRINSHLSHVAYAIVQNTADDEAVR